jgi:hypothetical protein
MSIRPEFHADSGHIEALMRRARTALAFEASMVDVVEALGVTPSEAYLIIEAAKLLGPIPDRHGWIMVFGQRR